MSDEPIKITDKRASARIATSGIEVARGYSDIKAALNEASAHGAALRAGRGGVASTDMSEVRQMGVSRRTAVNANGGASIDFATQRPRDPLFYWQQNNLPYDTDKAEDLKKLRQLCRILYRSHPLLGSAIDIFSKWPLTDMCFASKDNQLVDFYTNLFFDQLDYEEYLVDVGREYWCVGEAWPLGSFNEDLGVWEDDELINPDDVFLEKSPFLKDPRLSIRLPETLRKILRSGQPINEYQALIRSYPELMHFTGDNAKMPVSNVLLKQLRFKGDTFNPRGVPLMLRGLRPIIQEEMLNSAQDAIADRLYTPLVLAKLGASATDLGTNQPWVPTPDQIGEFESALDVALAADFRVLTTHFAVDMSSVFGREAMPNFDADFERIAGNQLQVFGMSKTMLSGAGSGETYAADALNRDLISQLLTTHQRNIKRFVKDRMLVVAEAQEHYDYEERNRKRYPIMEEVLVVDPESGAKRIVEQPKLLVPDLVLRTMNMAAEEDTRQFYEALRASGVPISIKTRMVNIPLDFDDEIDTTREEQIELAVQAQITRRETYIRLMTENLPIPDDLKADFGARAMDHSKDEKATAPTRIPTMGVDDPDHSALAPTPADMATPPGTPLVPVNPELAPAPAGGQVIPLPTNKAMPPALEGRTRPPESDEQRARMPKPASVKVVTGVDVNGEPVEEEYDRGLVAGPRHIGSRRYSPLVADEPMDEQQSG